MEDDLRNIKRAVPRDLWIKARAQALLAGKKVGDWITEAIREKLEREASDQYPVR